MVNFLLIIGCIAFYFIFFWYHGEFRFSVVLLIILGIIWILPTVFRILHHIWLFITSPLGIASILILLVLTIITLNKTHDRWGKKCAICHQTLHFGKTMSLKDGKICNACALKTGLDNSNESMNLAKTITINEAIHRQANDPFENPKRIWREMAAEAQSKEKAEDERYKELKKAFKENHTFKSGKFYTSDQRKQIFFDESLASLMYKYKYRLYDYNDLIDYQLTTTTTTIVEEHTGHTIVTNGFVSHTNGYTDRTPAIRKVKLVIRFTKRRREEITFLDRTIPENSSDYGHIRKKANAFLAALKHVKQLQ